MRCTTRCARPSCWCGPSRTRACGCAPSSWRSAPTAPRCRIHQTYVPEAFLAPEAQAGFESSLDRFAAYLAGLALSAVTRRARARPRCMAHDIAAEYARPGRPARGGGSRRVGRAVAVRGVAHPRGRGAHDDAGALRRPRLHGGARRRRRRLHATSPTRWRPTTARCRSPRCWPTFARRCCTRGSRPAAAPRARSTHCVIHCARHRGGGAAAAARARARASAPCSGSWRAGGRTEPVRGRSQRRGTAGGRPRLVLRLRRAGARAGAGAGPRGRRPALASGPPGRRGGSRASRSRKPGPSDGAPALAAGSLPSRGVRTAVGRGFPLVGYLVVPGSAAPASASCQRRQAT